MTGGIGLRQANHYGHPLLRVEPHVQLQTLGVDGRQIPIQRYNHLGKWTRSRNNYIDRSIIRIARNMVSNNVLVYNINNYGPKTLTWCTPETTSTEALTLPFKGTRCRLSLRNSDTMNKNYPSTLIELSIYCTPWWLILSNALIYKCPHIRNVRGGRILLLSKKWLNYSNTFDRRGVIEIGL